MQLCSAVVMLPAGCSGTPEIESENSMTSFDQLTGDSNHQRCIHRSAMQRVRVTEDREPVGACRGIDASLQRYTV